MNKIPEFLLIVILLYTGWFYSSILAGLMIVVTFIHVHGE